MDVLKQAGKILLLFVAIVVAKKFLVFLNARGLQLRGRDEPSKVEIQTLFHGNTKDEDQI